MNQDPDLPSNHDSHYSRTESKTRDFSPQTASVSFSFCMLVALASEKNSTELLRHLTVRFGSENIKKERISAEWQRKRWIKIMSGEIHCITATGGRMWTILARELTTTRRSTDTLE